MLPQDPFILFSYINTKLRDEYPSLDALCRDLDEDRAAIEQKLKKLGFRYDEENNRFA